MVSKSLAKRLALASALFGTLLPLGVATTPTLGQNPAGSVLDQVMVDVIVTLDPTYAPGSHAANEAAAEVIAQSFGLAASNSYGTVLFGFSASVPAGRLTAFEHDPRVLAVELVRPVSAMAPVDCSDPANADNKKCQSGGGGGGGGKPGGGGNPPPAQTTSWGYDRIGAAGHGVTGAGVHVYVFDSGIDSDHPDLADNIAASDHYAVPAVAAVCRGKKSCPQWEDDFHHGTEVAGIIGARDNGEGVVGVAPDVVLHAYKVLDKSGNGDDAGVIDAIDHLAGLIDAGSVAAPVVANMSFTTAGETKRGTCDGTGYVSDGSGDTYDSYHRAVCELARRGVIVVTGAGNGGADAANYVPAAYDESAIAASATNESDGWSYLSNYGTGAASWTPPAGASTAPVAIAAPGENILTTTTGGGYAENSGTSFAAPHVAGAVALWIEATTASCAGYVCYTAARDAVLASSEDLPKEESEPLLGQTNPHLENLLDVACLIDGICTP